MVDYYMVEKLPIETTDRQDAYEIVHRIRNSKLIDDKSLCGPKRTGRELCKVSASNRRIFSLSIGFFMLILFHFIFWTYVTYFMAYLPVVIWGLVMQYSTYEHCEGYLNLYPAAYIVSFGLLAIILYFIFALGLFISRKYYQSLLQSKSEGEQAEGEQF